MANSSRVLKDRAFALCGIFFLLAAANFFLDWQWFGRFGRSVLGVSLFFMALVIPWYESGRRR